MRNPRTRRAFLGEAVAMGAAGVGFGTAPRIFASDGLPILGARLGEPLSYEDSFGDVWSTTWADDNYLYSVSDDTRGFKNACNSNLAIHRISGETPPALEGTTINPMSDYGRFTETNPLDGGTWKGAGLTCVDGVLYLGVCRNGGAYVADTRGPDYWIQEAWDASIVKSVDHGKTWSPAPKIGQAMFPGRNFCFPCFVEYGKNGAGHKDEFVYAVSEDGSWNNASSMTMGRVPRDRVGRLDPRDWEFFHGFDKYMKPTWQPRHDTARTIFRSPGRTSMASIYYNAGLDVYILPQWSRDYTRPEVHDPANWPLRKKVTRFEFYQARAPWGPWTLFHEQIIEPQGFYCPVIPSKFVSRDGRRFWLFTAGNPPDKRWYRLTMIPVTLEVRV